MLAQQHAGGELHGGAEREADALAVQLPEVPDLRPGNQPFEARGDVLVADPLEAGVTLSHRREHSDLAEARELCLTR